MNTIFTDMAKVAGIIPVIAVEEAEDAVPLAEALLRGGIRFAEITFRTEAALEAIERIAQEVPEILVGAGTVISTQQMDQAIAAGAQFLVSPGFDLELVDYAKKKGCLLIPGIATPSELMAGLKEGLSCFKFFPASIYGGPKAIKALAGPFPRLSFIPTGGVTLDNLECYLELPAVLAVGGSWMCPQEDIREKNFKHIEVLAREATARFSELRGGNHGA